MAKNVFTVKLGDTDLGVFDEKNLTVEDAYLIENQGGITINRMLTGISGLDMNARALQTLVWFMRYKQGDRVDRASVNFNLTELSTEPVPDPHGGAEPDTSEA